MADDDDDDFDFDEVERTLREVDAKYATRPGAAQGVAATAANAATAAAAEPGQRRKPASKAAAASASKKSTLANTSVPGLSAADLAFMDEVDKDLAEWDHAPSESSRTTNVGAADVIPPKKNRKCFPLNVGGTDHPLGCNPHAAEPCCGNLLCVNCDFKVLSIDDYEWDDDCEYLFFRNFMPEVDKLRKKLHSVPGSRAYCCQCKWLSVKEVTKIQTLRGFHSKWVCRTSQ